MYTAKKNFAYAGKSYNQGDKIPAKIAKGLPEHLVEAPKAKTTTTEEISEGE
jgi:hypothetical protein